MSSCRQSHALSFGITTIIFQVSLGYSRPFLTQNCLKTSFEHCDVCTVTASAQEHPSTVHLPVDHQYLRCCLQRKRSWSAGIKSDQVGICSVFLCSKFCAFFALSASAFSVFVRSNSSFIFHAEEKLTVFYWDVSNDASWRIFVFERWTCPDWRSRNTERHFGLLYSVVLSCTFISEFRRDPAMIRFIATARPGQQPTINFADEIEMQCFVRFQSCRFSAGIPF